MNLANLSALLGSLTGVHNDAADKIVFSILIIVLFFALRTIFLAIGLRKVKDKRVAFLWKKTSFYATFFLSLLFLIKVWFQNFTSVLTFLGLLSAGIVLALKEPLTNMVAWFYIVTKKPFEIGDRIQVAGVVGDVVDIALTQFTVMEVHEQSTGKIIHIPNGKLFSDWQANYNKGFKYIWHEVPVVVSFDSDWRKAKSVFLKIANRHAENLSKEAELGIEAASRRYMMHYSKLTPAVYTKVQDNGIQLSIRFLCVPHLRRDKEQAIWEDVLDEINRSEDIFLAYLTPKVHHAVSPDTEASKDRTQTAHAKESAKPSDADRVD